MATPVLTDLRHQWPDAKITALCQNGLGAVIQNNPHLDEIQNFKRPGTKAWFSPKEQDLILEPLRHGNYDLSILLTNSFSSAWWFWRAGLKNKVGYSTHWRSPLLDFAIPFPQNRETQHLVLTYKMLLEPLGIPVSSTSPKLFLTDEELKSIKKRLAEEGVASGQYLIGVNPGAAYGSAKCWLPERFKQIAEKLIKNPKVTILFFGDKNGAPLVDEICREFPSDRVINFAGRTSLRELMALIQECDLFLTNDSGPMHMASALGTPLVALFGSTSDVATGPYQGGKVIHKHVPCSPCYRRECPIDFRCMTRIEVDEVYQELQSLIKLWS